MTLKRLVLLVEGDGDVKAVPVLVKRLLSEYSAFDAVILDEHPFRVGGYGHVGFSWWRRYLQAALKRRDVGACLLILDGDCDRDAAGQAFCAMRAARQLAAEARHVGAGTLFSVAIVFACMEFESWLIAGAPSLVGQQASDGRLLMPKPPQEIPPDPEHAPRNAKGWLGKFVQGGYSASRDQRVLTELIDLGQIRGRGMRSFIRLESAIKQLVDAIRAANHTVTPASEIE
jgi:hypothetical protein